jgi:hypothetical protein
MVQKIERAVSQLDVVIDVLSAWRDRYDDDDWPAGIGWIMDVIPQCQDEPRSGWLCVSGNSTPGIGWRLTSVFSVSSLCRSLRGHPWPFTRREFRRAARLSGVCLPSRHATLYLA